MKKLFTLLVVMLMTTISAFAAQGLVATPSVTEFSTVDDLAGMTITLTGTVPQYRSEMDCSYIFIEKASDPSKVYALATSNDYSVSNNVITINQFAAGLEGMTPLPTEETDLVFRLVSFFDDNDYLSVYTASVSYTPASTGLVATPSVTTFSTLDDLKGLTITFSGTVPQVEFEYPGGIFLAAADLDPADPDPSKMYALAYSDDMWFYADKVIVDHFTPFPNFSFPAAECDLALFLVGIFKDQEEELIPVSIHYTPAGSPAFVMDANTDGNTAKIFAKLGTVANVTINNLTIKGGKWNTICLPFNLSSSEIETAFGAGAEVAKLASSSYDAAEEALSLNFTSVTEMEAGDPYVIKVTADVANPTFADVTLATYECQTVTTDYASMKGDFDKHFLTGGDQNTWFISNNTFYYPSEDGSLAATKCWFNLLGEAQQSSTSAKAKSIRMNIFGSEATAIHSVTPATKVSGNEVYNLQGVRVSNPTKKGIYIRNGVKMVVK